MKTIYTNEKAFYSCPSNMERFDFENDKLMIVGKLFFLPSTVVSAFSNIFLFSFTEEESEEQEFVKTQLK